MCNRDNTKSALSVIHDLEAAMEIEGTNFSLCEVGIQEDVKRLIPEPAYRTQLCQHAVATQIVCNLCNVLDIVCVCLEFAWGAFATV